MTTAAVRWMVVGWRELERWDYLSNFQRRNLRCAFPLAAIGDMMAVRRQRATPVELMAGEVRMLDRVSFDGEIFAGDRQRTKMDQWVAEPGDIVVSKIRARQGSVGLVEPEHGKIGVTSHYRALTPDPIKIHRKYAHLAMRSAYGKAQFLAATGGAMKGEISEEALLEVRLPMPPLAVQQKIVAAWAANRKAAAATAAKIAQLEADIEARFLADLGLKAPAQAALHKCFAVRWRDFPRWSVNHNQLAQSGMDLTRSKFPLAAIGALATMIQYGTSEKANSTGDGTPVIRMNNLVGGQLDLRNLKHLRLSTSETAKLALVDGDILFNRTNSKELVGKCAVFHEEGEYVFASYLIRVRMDAKRADPDYVAYALNCPIGRQQIDAMSRQIIGQANINSEELRSLQVPLPPLSSQRQIVGRLAKRRTEIAKLKADAKTRADAAKADVEAMILGTKPAA